MDKTFTSLKPRFQSAKVAPGRVTDEPESDMKESNGPMMNKKSTSNHAQSGSRIEKLNVNTRKKGSRNGKTWSDRFKRESIWIAQVVHYLTSLWQIPSTLTAPNLPWRRNVCLLIPNMV